MLKNIKRNNNDNTKQKEVKIKALTFFFSFFFVGFVNKIKLMREGEERNQG